MFYNLAIPRFLVQSSPRRHRILLLGAGGSVSAVATLDPADADGDLVVEELNQALFTGRREQLDKTLGALPSAVALSCRQALSTVPGPAPFGLDPWDGEPVYGLRRVYITEVDELVQYAEAARMLDFGLLASNYRQHDGELGWEVSLLSETPHVPASAEPRAWALPEDVPLLATHQPRPAKLLEALEDVADDGKRIHLHWIWQSESDDLEDTSTAEWILDVFDCPPPLEENED